METGGRQGNWAYAGNLTLRQAGAYDTPRGVVPNTGLEERNGMLQLGSENHAARWQLAWQVRPDLSLAFNVGRAWRAPTLNELFSRDVHEGTSRFMVGTPTLRPEQSLSLDGTLRWLRPRCYLELNAFVNRIDHFIFPRPPANVIRTRGFSAISSTRPRRCSGAASCC